MFTGTPTLIIGVQISGVTLYISHLSVHIISYLSSIIFVTSNLIKMLKFHIFLKTFVYFNMKMFNKSLIYGTQAKTILTLSQVNKLYTLYYYILLQQFISFSCHSVFVCSLLSYFRMVIF